MKYYAVKFQIRCAPELMQTARELLANDAVEAGFEAFEDTEQGLIGYVQTEVFYPAILDEQIASFVMPDVHISYTTEEMESKNWNETWEEQGFDPISIDNRCMIYDARQTPPADSTSTLQIGIEAKMAFGTGTHETTRLMVRKLLDNELTGKRVLDCGCGTGILSIVASKLGASEVIAYDIDEWSVENTLHNAELNHVENLHVLHGDAQVLTHISGVFDVVVANINRNILLADLPTFVEVLTGTGTLILSGFYKEDAPLLIEEAGRHHLRLVDEISDNNWTCLCFVQ